MPTATVELGDGVGPYPPRPRPRLAAASGPARVPNRRPAPPGHGQRWVPYGLAALRAEVPEVRAAPVGDRNNRLNRAAFSLGMLAAGGELDPGHVEDELLTVALNLGLPEAEATASVHSGLRAGGREPRRRPERQSTTR